MFRDQSPVHVPVALSDREQRIVELVLQGKTNREISEELGISAQVVKNHVTSILRKLQSSRGDVIRFGAVGAR
jgi:DNA-binding NarL/FixJ family response regulator